MSLAHSFSCIWHGIISVHMDIWLSPFTLLWLAIFAPKVFVAQRDTDAQALTRLMASFGHMRY